MSLRDSLDAYLDGELGADERAEIEAALANDEALLSELNALKRLSNSLQVEASDREAAARIGERLRRRRGRRFLWPLLPLTAGLLTLFLLLAEPAPAPAPVLTGDDLLHQYSEAVSWLDAETDGLAQ